MAAIAVVDYGTGNLRSVAKALVHVAPGTDVTVSSDPAVIRAASHVVLPGQSAMPDTMANLDASGLRSVVLECLRDRPFLGVCLGLQMLFETSEEGPTRALGALAGRVEKFRDEAMTLPSGERLKVPHMGWSPVRQTRAHPLWAGIDDSARFYFAHSYHLRCEDSSDIVASVNHGMEVPCVVQRQNVFGAQFHPEKSHQYGMEFFRNFAEI